MQDFAGLCVGLYGVCGVGCDWCVGFLFREHAFGRILESRDAFSRLEPDLVMGGCSFVFVSLGGGWAIGHIVWARGLQPSMVSTTIVAAMSIWSVVIYSASVS